MSVWTPELSEECERLYRSGMSAGAVAKFLGLTRNQVIGRLDRKGVLRRDGYNRDHSRSRERHKTKRAEKETQREVMDNGSWDAKLFEPWVVRKARLARERANAL